MTTDTVTDLKPKAKYVERITINESLKDKLQSLTHQANEALQGMSSISKSDVINFILKIHSSRFSENEMKELRAEHFDEVKFSQWITAQLKESQAKGESRSLRELIEQNLKLFDSDSPKRPRTRSIKVKTVHPTSSEGSGTFKPILQEE